MTDKMPMRAFSVVGISTSGKTTVVEQLVRELTRRNFSVGTVKSIGCGRSCKAHVEGKCDGTNHDPKYGFSLDTVGKNSYRHKEAGSLQVSTWAKGETAIMYPYEMKMYEIIDKYDFDFLIFEGGRDYSLPRITTGITTEDIKSRRGETTIAYSGKIAEEIDEFEGIKAYRTYDDIEELADLIIEKVHPAIAMKDECGCTMCGMSCKEMNIKILKGEKSFSDCKRAFPEIEINSDDEKLKEVFRKALIKMDIKDFPRKFNIEI